MSPERWREVRHVVEHVVERPACEWPVLVHELCGQSVELREEVESLLAHHRTESIPRPLLEVEAPDPIEPESIRLERFDILRLIGRGGFGNVFHVYDRERGQYVALKSLRHLDPKAIRGFKKGFRLLRDVRHPNLVQMHDLIYDGRSFYLSMELVDGVDLSSFLSACPKSRLDVVRQLAEGIHWLHERGILHRDIKPSNVRVTPQGRVVVLDFGMARESYVPFPSGSGVLVGTPHYIAPELVDGGAPTRASDWYAVGVILFELLTEALPFDGSGFEVLLQKRDQPAPFPVPSAGFVQNDPGFPTDIVRLCSQLLERDPKRRPGGSSIAARLGAVEPTRRVPSPSNDIVGRRRHLERLRESVERSRMEATVVRLGGRSGAGKTTLVGHFLKEISAERKDVVSLTGRCYLSEALPYKALDEIVDELARYLSRLPADEIEAILPRNAALLPRLFPVLSQLTVRHAVGASERPVPDVVELRRRSFVALRELLGRLAERRRVVVFVDDAQWGDLDSVPLLAELIAPPDAPPILWLFAHRTGEDDSCAFVSELLSRPSLSEHLHVDELDVGTLSEQEARELAASLLLRAGHSEARHAAATIASESGGSPLFVHQLVEHWTEVGTAPTLDRILSARVAALPRGPRELLELIAVSGRRLEESVVNRVVPSREGIEYRDRLVADRLAHPSAGHDDGTLDVFHDRLRESILANLTVERARALHSSLAMALEDEGGVEPERLMRHFELGGDRDKALRYMERAAETAAAALAFDRASELYRKTLTWRDHSREKQATLRRRLADSLSNAGRSREAAEQFMETARMAAPEDRFELRRLAAEHWLRSGHVPRGVELLRSLCVESGIWYPKKAWQVLLSTLFNRARVRLRGLPPGRPNGTTPSRQAIDQMNLCWTAGFGIGLIDAFLGSDFHSRFFLLATKLGEPRRVALALAAETAYCAFPGESGRARGDRVYRQFETIAGELDDPLVDAFGLTMRGTMAWLLGDFRDARVYCDRALAIFEEESVAVGWERTTAQIIAYGAASTLGDWRDISDSLPPLIETAKARGDLYAHVGLRLMPYPYVLRLAADDPDGARAEIMDALSRWTPDGFHIQHCDAMFGLVDVCLYEGRGWDALDLIESRRDRLRRSFLLLAQLTRIFFHAFRARAALSALGSDAGAPAQRERARKLLRRDLRRVKRERTAWSRGWCLLLEAGVLSLDGRHERAVATLAAAEPELERSGQNPYRAAAQWRRGALVPGSEGRALQAEAEAWMRARGIEVPERFANMFVPGRWG